MKAEKLSPLSFLAIASIKIYRWFLKPILGQHCRFYPSCSQYAMTAFTEFGFFKGFWLAFRRILRCNPWHSGGFDPVPEKVDHKNSVNLRECYMDFKKFFVIAGVFFIALLLWDAWQKDYGLSNQPVTPSSKNSVSGVTSNQQTKVSGVGSSSTQSGGGQQNTKLSNALSSIENIPQNRLIHVKTDVFDLSIDTLGGGIVGVGLHKYPETLNSKKPYILLNDNPDTVYVAQDGITDMAGQRIIDGQMQFVPEKKSYVLGQGKNELAVRLVWTNANHRTVEKIYHFQRDKYVVDTEYKISNQGNNTWKGHLYSQLTRREIPPKNQSMFYIHSYQGAAISSADKHYEKISLSDMQKQDLNRAITGGWLAIQQHYFLSAWVPPSDVAYDYYSNMINDSTYTIGMRSPMITLASGAKKTFNSKFYSGPEVAKRLDAVAPNLKLTVDYGWLWPISVAIFWLMTKIFSVVGNWGWSIVLVTITIKALLYWPSAVSYRSMAKLRKLQPKMNTIKERFKDDRQKVGQAMMELYKKEGVNPLGGCLPILLQIPVFIALYWVLLESVELRQAPFIFWIHDLAIKDPFYVLPIIMGSSMILQQRLSPAPPDPVQAKMMMLLPIVFTFLFANFPSGLVLYWVVNNLVSIGQQWYITQKYMGDNKPRNKKRSGKSGRSSKFAFTKK